MNIDEALEKATLGFAVRHNDMTPESYIHYEFQGYRIQFVNNGIKGSSSNWLPSERDKEADWYVSNATIHTGGWGDLVQICWDIDAAVNDVIEEPTIEEHNTGWAIFNKKD